MKTDGNMCKARIKYPCQWLYKIIGHNREKLEQALKEIISPDNDTYAITFSNSSRSGKYLCLNLEMTVRSEEERNSIYLALKKHPHIRIVL